MNYTCKFKEGDRVKIKDTPNVRWWGSGEKAIGQIGTIDKHSNWLSSIYFIDDNKYGINFKDDDLELVTEEIKLIPKQYIKGEYYVANCIGPINSGNTSEEYVIEYDKLRDTCHYSNRYYVIGNNGIILIMHNTGGFYNIVRKATEKEKEPFLKEDETSSKQSEPVKPIDSWCVKVTEENREIVKKHVDSGGLYSIGSYYGVEKLGNFGGWYQTKDWSDYFNKLLTTEEFYQKVGHVPSSLPFKFGELAYVYKDGFGCGIGDLGVHILYDKTKVGSAKYSGYESRIYAIWCPKENVYKCIDTSAIRAATSQEIAQYKYPEVKESVGEFSPSGKFKIGDIIIGNSKATYAITKKGWLGEIISFSYSGLTVKSLKGDFTFNDLTEDCFDLYQRGGLTMASISEFDAQTIEKAVADWSIPPYNLDLSYDKNPTILKKSKKSRLITCDF